MLASNQDGKLHTSQKIIISMINTYGKKCSKTIETIFKNNNNNCRLFAAESHSGFFL